MSVLRLAALALGGGLLALFVAVACGKCQSWFDALIAVVGAVAFICVVVGAWWLLRYGVTGEWWW
jgi:hypothetical protein